MQVVRVLTFNVRSLRDDVGAVMQIIRTAAPDLVFVQEAPRFLRWRSKCAALAAACGMVTIVGGAPASGNLLMCRIEVAVSATGIVRFPRTPGQHARAAALAECQLGAARFVAAGTHLGLTATERLQHAPLLLQAAADFAATLLIVAGDMNEPPDSPLWNLLATHLTAAGGADTTPTFSTTKPRRRIDAIFVDPRIRVADYRVWNADPDLAHRATDHFAVGATLEIPT